MAPKNRQRLLHQINSKYLAGAGSVCHNLSTNQSRSPVMGISCAKSEWKDENEASELESSFAAQSQTELFVAQAEARK